MKTRLQNIVTAATNLTTKLNSVSKEIQQSRTDADQKIAQQVDQRLVKRARRSVGHA